MPFTRNYQTIIPVDPDADLDVLRWLTRESFERKAEGDCLRIVEFLEAEVAPDDLPPKAAKQLGKPLTEFQWHRFSATATNA
jgi:hypothetical protein